MPRQSVSEDAPRDRPLPVLRQIALQGALRHLPTAGPGGLSPRTNRLQGKAGSKLSCAHVRRHQEYRQNGEDRHRSYGYLEWSQIGAKGRRYFKMYNYNIILLFF